MELRYTGIIIGKRDVREADRLYSVYTLEQGRLGLLARGVRKPNAKLAGNLETLTLSEIYVNKGKGKGNVTGAIPLNGFLALKSDFQALERAFRAISYFSRFVTQEEKDEGAFVLLSEYLLTMDDLASCGSQEDRMESVTLGFLFKLFGHLGYAIDASACGRCGGRLEEGGNFFSPSAGAIICRDCGASVPGTLRISDAGVKLLRIFQANGIRNLAKLSAGKADLANLESVLRNFAGWLR